jgi:sugar-specific transcriptional regulator TrmB
MAKMAESERYKILEELGFSRTAVICYEDLFERGPAHMSELAKRLGLPRVSLYRVLRQLTAKGFTRSVKSDGQVTYFYAQPIERALRNYIDYQWRLAEPAIVRQDGILARRSGRPRHYRGRPTTS